MSASKNGVRETAQAPAQAEYRGFVVDARGFGKRQRLPFEQVRSLQFWWQDKTVKESLNFMPMGSHHEHTAELQVRTLDAKRPIKIKAGVIGPFKTGLGAEKQCEALYTVSRLLHHHTFDYRFQHYAAEVERTGRFQYTKVTFRRDGMVTDGKKTFNIRSAILRRNAYGFSIGEPPKTFRQRWWSGNEIDLATVVDRDVFYAMLNAMYGIDPRRIRVL